MCWNPHWISTQLKKSNALLQSLLYEESVSRTVVGLKSRNSCALSGEGLRMVLLEERLEFDGVFGGFSLKYEVEFWNLATESGFLEANVWKVRKIWSWERRK